MIKYIKEFFKRKSRTDDYLEQVLGLEGVRNMHKCWMVYQPELEAIQHIRAMNFKANLAKLTYAKEEIPKLIENLIGMENDFIRQCYNRIEKPKEDRRKKAQAKKDIETM